MSANRASTIERILNGIENYVEDWRKENAARQGDAEANRDELWAEAAERERLLREAVNEEESRQDALEEVTKRCRVVFVLHSGEVAGTLEDFAAARGPAGEGDPRRRQLLDRLGGRGLVAGIRGVRVK